MFAVALHLFLFGDVGTPGDASLHLVVSAYYRLVDSYAMFLAGTFSKVLLHKVTNNLPLVYL